MSDLLTAHLQRLHLLPSTQQKYQEILDTAHTSNPKALISWTRNQVDSTTPLGTVLPIRAAVKHYLTGVLHYSEAEVNELLPAAKGVEAEITQPLSQEQLALYHMAVEEIHSEPAHTILLLLPATGMQVTELCNLEVKAVEGHTLKVRKKRDSSFRIIPLTPMASSALSIYIDEKKPSHWLFPGYGDSPICSHAIRKYTRNIAERYPELSGLSPRVLRSTFARMQLQKGAGLKRLQELMGHESSQTTSRYLDL